MYLINNKKQLSNAINIHIKKILDEIADEVFNELKTNVNEEIYSWTPSKYIRTRNLIDSITRTSVNKIGKLYQVYIYFDSDKIEADYRMPDLWNAHASFSGEEVDGNELIGWLEYGNYNRVTDKPNKYYQHPEYGFFKETLEWLNEELNNMIKIKLIKYGFTI